MSKEMSTPTILSPVAKKVKSTVVSKPRPKAVHPPTSEMVNSAIKELNERTGSSLQAIKKYVSANYTVDPEKIAPFIKKYLKSAVTNGKLIQTKGIGASGSFKLSPSGKEKSAAKKLDVPKKTKATSTEKEPKAKKVASPAEKKKPAATSDEKKKEKAAAPAKAAKTASSVKIVKPTKPKAAEKKPKSPTPKKTAPTKKATSKKAAAPKKK